MLLGLRKLAPASSLGFSLLRRYVLHTQTNGHLPLPESTGYEFTGPNEVLWLEKGKAAVTNIRLWKLNFDT